MATLRVRNGAVVASVAAEWATYLPAVRFGSSTFNVTCTGVWRGDGSWIDVEVMWVVNGAPASGRLQWDLPVPVAQMGLNCGQQIGGVLMVDQGTGRRTAFVMVEGGPSTSSVAFIDVVGGGFGTYSIPATETNPWTWANQDGGVATIRYRA